MAKGSSAVWIDQLVNLLGLDKETVKTQILPFLDSFDSEASLRDHLQGLVGTDTPLAKSFVRDFTRSRFLQQAATISSGTSTPPTATPAATSNSSHGGQKKRGKKTLAERAGIGQPLAPRKLEDAGMDEEEQMAKLAEAFGGMGTVYRKKQGEEEFFAGTGKGRKGKQTGSRNDAQYASDTPQFGYATPVEPVAAVDPVTQSTSTYEEPSTSTAKPSPPPTAEMLAIDAVVQELTSTDAATSSTSSKTIHRKMCFCQGRKHPLAPYAPLCYSCGLILCSAIHPSPLSPLSSCPSCNATPLLSTAARSDLVVKLTTEREVLVEQQQLQIQLQREMKKLNKATARSAREEEAALFPKLGMEASSGSAAVAHAGPAMGKHGALQKAKAIAGDAQRTAKVLSLDMKTHKVKTHTKVTRPKPAAVVDAASTKAEEQEEEDVENDPFVGLDGSALVKDEADDGVRSKRGVGKNEKPRSGKGDKSMPSRTWTFKDQQLTLRPSPSVH